MTLSHQGDAIAGYIYRTIRLSLTPTPHGKLYDSFTWNGAQVSSAIYTLYYKIDGFPQPDGKVLFEATYGRCSGACGDIDNDPRSQDLKGRTARCWDQTNSTGRVRVSTRKRRYSGGSKFPSLANG